MTPSQSQSRLETFFSSAYASQNLEGLADHVRIDDKTAIRMTCWTVPDNGKTGFKQGLEALSGTEAVGIDKGHRFGPPWSNHWLKVELAFPPSFRSLGPGQIAICERSPFLAARFLQRADLVQSNSTRRAKPSFSTSRDIRSTVSRRVVTRDAALKGPQVSRAGKMFWAHWRAGAVPPGVA